MNLVTEVLFPGDGTWTKLTSPADLIRYKSKSIDQRLMNDDRKSVVDTFNLTLRHDNNLVNRFFAVNGRILARVTKIDTTAVFTGYVAPTFDQTVRTAVEGLSLELLDNSYLLDNKIAASFQYPAVIGAAPFKIFDQTDTTHSIVHLLLQAAGYTVPDCIAAGMPNITTTILHIAGTKDESTYRDVIDTILSEHGWVFYFDGSGKFALYHWDPDTVTPTLTIQTNFGTVEGLTRSKKDVEFDGVEVVWAETKVQEDALLYREDLPFTTATGELGFTGQDIAAGDYFPADGDITDLFQDFVAKWLDIPYLRRETRLENKDISLITTSNHAVVSTEEAGVAVFSQSFESHRSKVLFKNSAAATKKLYTFEVRGTALYRSAIRKTLVPTTSKLPQTYTSKNIFNETAAVRLANAMNTVREYGDFTYTWAMREDYPVGTIVTIDLADPDMTTTAIITSYKHNYDSPMRSYEAVGISEHVTVASVLTGSQRVNTVALQDWVEARLSVTPSFVDLQEGYALGGGTITPSVPTVSGVRAAYKTLVVSWDGQPALTNFDRYEIQVSADGSTNWASLTFDGTGNGIGTVGADTDFYSEYLLHTMIPFAGTLDAPTGRTLYYRVRRVTRTAVVSAWSAVASGTTVTAGSGDLSANSISIGKFVAGTRPVEIVASLPAAGTAGRVVVLTTDSKLYRDTGTAWTVAVPTCDLTGYIGACQIAACSITADQLAANAITAAKICAGAVGTDQLAANAVTAAKIQTGVLNALIAEISAYLAISDVTGWTAGTGTGVVTGCQRAFMDKNEIRLQWGCGTNTWCDAVRIGGCADGCNCYPVFVRDTLLVGGAVALGWSTFCTGYKVSVGGPIASSVGFSSYVADGLWGATAVPAKFGTPGQCGVLIGFYDNANGGYFPRIGFQQDYSAGGSPGTTTNCLSMGFTADGSFTITTKCNTVDGFSMSANGNIAVGNVNTQTWFRVWGGTAANLSPILSVVRSAIAEYVWYISAGATLGLAVNPAAYTDACLNAVAHVQVSNAGNVQISCCLTVLGCQILQGISNHSTHIKLLDKSTNNWLMFACRNTAGADAVYDLYNIGLLNTSGILTVTNTGSHFIYGSLIICNTAASAPAFQINCGSMRVLNGSIIGCSCILTPTACISGSIWATTYCTYSAARLKTAKSDICITDCIRARPDMKVQEWTWLDERSRDFDRRIAPYAEDVQDLFRLSADPEGYALLDGIAFGGVVELTRELDSLRAEVCQLKEAICGNRAA